MSCNHYLCQKNAHSTALRTTKNVCTFFKGLNSTTFSNIILSIHYQHLTRIIILKAHVGKVQYNHTLRKKTINPEMVDKTSSTDSNCNTKQHPRILWTKRVISFVATHLIITFIRAFIVLTFWILYIIRIMCFARCVRV